VFFRPAMTRQAPHFEILSAKPQIVVEIIEKVPFYGMFGTK